MPRRKQADCPCIGHKQAGVRHMAPCCDGMHIDQKDEYDNEDV